MNGVPCVTCGGMFGQHAGNCLNPTPSGMIKDHVFISKDRQSLLPSLRCSYKRHLRRPEQAVPVPPGVNIKDVQVHTPPHYRQGAIECIDAIEAALTPDEFTGYLKGNIQKYLWRCRWKGGMEDMKKAQWYLNRLIASASTAGPSSDAPVTGAPGAGERS